MKTNMDEIKQQSKELWGIKIGPKSNQFLQEKVLFEIIELTVVKVLEETSRVKAVEMEFILEQERERVEKIVKEEMNYHERSKDDYADDAYNSYVLSEWIGNRILEKLKNN